MDINFQDGIYVTGGAKQVTSMLELYLRQDSDESSLEIISSRYSDPFIGAKVPAMFRPVEKLVTYQINYKPSNELSVDDSIDLQLDTEFEPGEADSIELQFDADPLYMIFSHPNIKGYSMVVPLSEEPIDRTQELEDLADAGLTVVEKAEVLKKKP